VDLRFGTKDDLRELVRQAHALGMYVILDVIINHSGDNWAYPRDLPYSFWKAARGPFFLGFWREADPAPGFQADDAVWPRELQLPDCYKRRGQIRDWGDSEEDTHGDFLSLKELDITRPEVLDALIQIPKYWIARRMWTDSAWTRSSTWRAAPRPSSATPFASMPCGSESRTSSSSARSWRMA
jgi:glycosidase